MFNESENGRDMATPTVRLVIEADSKPGLHMYIHSAQDSTGAVVANATVRLPTPLSLILP